MSMARRLAMERGGGACFPNTKFSGGTEPARDLRIQQIQNKYFEVIAFFLRLLSRKPQAQLAPAASKCQRPRGSLVPTTDAVEGRFAA